jgi:hypothetical protein
MSSAMASKMYGDDRAPIHFKASYAIIQPMLDLVKCNFVVAAATVYLANYLVLDNELERASSLFSLVLSYLRSDLKTFQAQSTENWVRGGLLNMIFFMIGLTLFDNSRDYIRMTKSLVYSSRVRKVEAALLLGSKIENIAELQEKAEIVLKDLIEGSEDFHVDLNVIDLVVAQYGEVLDARKEHITNEYESETRRIHVLMCCHAGRIQIMERQERPLNELRRSADFIAKLSKSLLFPCCLVIAAEVLFISMQVHIRCVSEEGEKESALESLREEVTALRYYSEQYLIVKDRYMTFIWSTESLIASFEKRKKSHYDIKKSESAKRYIAPQE